MELKRYINRGAAEIHWENKKLSHFELIGQLLQSEYNQPVKFAINRMLEKWDGIIIEKNIEQVDSLVPESHSMYKIPANRKRLINKILTLRRQRLEELLHERV